MTSPEPAAEEIRACRACLSTKIEPLGFEKRFYLSNVDRIVEMPYSACTSCGLIFQATYVGDEFLEYYYHHSPMLRRAEVTAFEEDQHRRQSEFLSRQVPLRGTRVLEIGAGSGGFLRHLHEQLSCETYFDDLSDEATETMLKIPGLRKVASGDSAFDVVVLRHVLEHVNNLDSFVASVIARLGNGGVVFIEVPDWSRFDNDCDPLIFEHLSQFNPRSLIRLFERFDCGCVAMERSICPTDPATPNRVLRAAFEPGIARPSDVVRNFRSQYLPLQERLADTVNRLVAENPGRTIGLYPASHLSYSVLLETDLAADRVIGMFDVDAKKHGKKFNGIQIYPAEMLRTLKPDIVLITTMAYEDEIRSYLGSIGIDAEIHSLKILLDSVGTPRKDARAAAITA